MYAHTTTLMANYTYENRGGYRLKCSQELLTDQRIKPKCVRIESHPCPYTFITNKRYSFVCPHSIVPSIRFSFFFCLSSLRFVHVSACLSVCLFVWAFYTHSKIRQLVTIWERNFFPPSIVSSCGMPTILYRAKCIFDSCLKTEHGQFIVCLPIARLSRMYAIKII